MSNNNEEELRRLSVELQLFEQTAEGIQNRINMINIVITDLTNANTTLEILEKEDNNAELLVPIGGSSYIKSKLEDKDTVILGVGAGVSIEKKTDVAKDIIEKRLDSLRKTRMTLQNQFAQVVDKIREDREKINNLVSELKKGKISQDV